MVVLALLLCLEDMLLMLCLLLVDLCQLFAGDGVERGRCRGFGASEHSRLGLLEGEEGGGASGHCGTAQGRRRA